MKEFGNDGIMEQWNEGIMMGSTFLQSLLKVVFLQSISNIQYSKNPVSHYSIVPMFHYSKVVL